MADYLDCLPTPVKAACFGYLSMEDLGKLSLLSREIHSDVLSDCIWKRLYPATFSRARDSIPEEVQSLVNRPYRRNSVGWSVSVLQDGSDVWLTGTVLDYRNELFLVRYDVDDREEWERETMTGGAWFIAGKLRIKFHSAPSALSSSSSPEESKTLRVRAPSLGENLTMDQVEFEVRRPKQKAKRSIDSRTPQESPRTCIARDVSASGGCAPESPGSHSWRCEAFRDRTMAPTKLLTELKVHEDEVLCVSFSNESNRLASCSRDGTTRIHDFYFTWRDKKSISISESCVVIRHNRGDVPCRVSWSPDDSLILVSTEAKNGNIFDYDAHVACYDSISGKRLFKRPNIPFDVCAAWIPGSRVFIHGESLSVSPRGTYHQVLSLFDCDDLRTVGRFHFRFVNEAFIHLIQVSPDGNFLAVTCGLGDALSDTVRVIRIPTRRNGFEIRVPRTKFDCKKIIANSHLRGKSILNLNSIGIGKLVGMAAPFSDGDSVVPSFYCGGAVLGLTWSRDSRRFFTNTRGYLCPSASQLAGIRDTIPNSLLSDRPDLDNTLEIQEWIIENSQSSSSCSFSPILSRIKGAHGFTTKDCPFYLFLAESPCGEYVASGSEDCGVYIYHIRHKRLMRVLWNGHEDVVSIVSWNPLAASSGSCLLASASDDKKICVWSTSTGINVSTISPINRKKGDETKFFCRAKKQRVESRSG